MSQHEPRPVGDFQGADAAWAWAVVQRLQERGASTAEVHRVVGDLHDAHRASRIARQQGLYAAFGDPAAFADQWQQTSAGESDGDFMDKSAVTFGKQMGMPVQMGPVMLIALMVVSAFAGAFAGGLYGDGGTGVHVTAGFVVGLLGPLAVVLGCTLLPMKVLVRHPFVLMGVLFVVLMALIVIAAIWQQPLVWIPRRVLAGTATVLWLASFVGLRVAAHRAIGKGFESIGTYGREISWFALFLTPVVAVWTYLG